MYVRQAISGALIAAVALAAACSDSSPTAVAEQETAAHFGHNAQGGAEIGTTLGWLKGETVEFFYNKPFFCKEPPASGADSKCEAGAEPQVFPRGGNIPVLYVMTPLGFTPTQTLQCPVAGDCINHPSTIDLSRVFGPGTENFVLPPHSHIVDTKQGNWWEIEVVGVTNQETWNKIEAGKSLATVRSLQSSQQHPEGTGTGAGITGDIPSNLFLFFSVRPSK